jgi:hypothetical protein
VTALGSSRSQRRRERSRSRAARARRIAGWLLGLIVLLTAFLAGLAIGKAVEEAPNPGGTQTIVRTIEPLTVEPRERTVTVTTTGR